jgi:hypothetical protein
MVKKIMIREHNCETGETIDREATQEEMDQIAKDAESLEMAKAENKLKSEQKAAILQKLGITQEEADLLLS